MIKKHDELRKFQAFDEKKVVFEMEAQMYFNLVGCTLYNRLKNSKCEQQRRVRKTKKTKQSIQKEFFFICIFSKTHGKTPSDMMSGQTKLFTIFTQCIEQPAFNRN